MSCDIDNTIDQSDEIFEIEMNEFNTDFVQNFGADREQLMEINKKALKSATNVEERYNVKIKMKDWESRFSPTFKRIKTALSKI